MTKHDTVDATWDGPTVYMPALGTYVRPGDTLTIPAAMADGDTRWSVGKPAKAKQPAAEQAEPDDKE
jgi:hypothetical protein